MRQERPRMFAGLGAVLAALAVLWLVIGVPITARLPANLDARTGYQGQFVVFADPATGAPLATPITMPLDITRHVFTVEGEVGANRALVQEDVFLDLGVRTETKTARYLIDRRSMGNEPDDRVANGKADGTYSVNLPMDASSARTYSMWKPETGTSYPLRWVEGARRTEVDGLTMLRMRGDMPPTPVTLNEAAALAEQGLPLSLPSEQVLGRLAAAGVDVGAVTAALRPVLTPEEASTLLAALSGSVPLSYRLASSGDALIEPNTGMIVSIAGVVERLTVQPDLATSAPALAVLRRHADVPGVAGLLQALTALSTGAGQPVYELRYSQTPASVAERVEEARDGVRALRVVEVYVPGGLALLAGAMFLVALWLSRHPAPAAPVRIEPRPVEAPPKAA